MDYESIVAKQKENNRIYHDLVVDMQTFISLAPQVLNQTGQKGEEYQNACDYVRTLCDRGARTFAEFKQIIPSNHRD